MENKKNYVAVTEVRGWVNGSGYSYSEIYATEKITAADLEDMKNGHDNWAEITCVSEYDADRLREIIDGAEDAEYITTVYDFDSIEDYEDADDRDDRKVFEDSTWLSSQAEEMLAEIDD